jgi:hypothetical protein
MVAEYFRLNGYEYADSAGAGRSGSDVTGVPFDVEVKARRGFNPSAALKQLKARKSDRLGFAVLRLDGQGKAEDFAVIIRLEDFIELVRINADL